MDHPTPTGRPKDRIGTTSHQRSKSTGNKPRQQRGESETEIIVADDDGEVLTDGGEVPNLTGGTTGASEKSDIKVDEKTATELRIGPMSEDRAKALRARIAREADVPIERIKKEEIRIGVDSR